MGTYYEFAVVHGRVLIWWTDLKGKPHERWIEGAEAEVIIQAHSNADFMLQSALRRAVGDEQEGQ